MGPIHYSGRKYGVNKWSKSGVFPHAEDLWNSASSVYVPFWADHRFMWWWIGQLADHCKIWRAATKLWDYIMAKGHGNICKGTSRQLLPQPGLKNITFCIPQWCWKKKKIIPGNVISNLEKRRKKKRKEAWCRFWKRASLFTIAQSNQLLIFHEDQSILTCTPWWCIFGGIPK